MQQGIKKDPSLVIKLRATFLKVKVQILGKSFVFDNSFISF
jgi:hypothetical protein